MENRVYFLYRVSTDKQVDYNDKSQAGIPMQRKACHRFAEEKGWTIIHEKQEDGVSDHKVRAENRDKLTNYIRFWQADGESEKTSIRTKTALGRLVEDGGFKGGMAPYGYDLVKSGRVNKRKHEVYELAVNEAEAAVVRIIFEKYVNEGFGTQRIATQRSTGTTNCTLILISTWSSSALEKTL